MAPKSHCQRNHIRPGPTSGMSVMMADNATTIADTSASGPMTGSAPENASPNQSKSPPSNMQRKPVQAAQLGPVHSQSAPLQLQSGPVHTQNSPLQSQSGPVQAHAGPVQAQSRPVHTLQLGPTQEVGVGPGGPAVPVGVGVGVTTPVGVGVGVGVTLTVGVGVGPPYWMVSKYTWDTSSPSTASVPSSDACGPGETRR